VLRRVLVKVSGEALGPRGLVAESITTLAGEIRAAADAGSEIGARP
jgi:uridylate kinase